MLSDTHLGLRDAREEPFSQYSKRMAGAYVKTRHAKSGQPTTPQDSFMEGIASAKKSKADLLALPGDLFSFPSEANVEWASQKLLESGLTWLYTSGNHDWHYEGMEGSSQELRDAWIQKRLLPLYGGANPLISSRDIKGLRVIVLDNSTYEILPEQLNEFRRLLQGGMPSLLFIHIPLYAPGRPMGFGCGHPDWGARSDKNFAIERRPKWRETGHTQTTFDFHREVLAATNLLAVFAGHTHQPSLDLLNGIPQVVTDDNASGGRLEIEVLPLT
ncbi:metallophosphoesterase family protein [Roseimicrobium gellanilyticum]|nr:metallophosphoesterase [Roseimicrobium gellanilyticum]